MNEHIWETFDSLFQTIHRQGRRIEELERRIAALEVQMSEVRHKAGVTEVNELYEQARADVLAFPAELERSAS